jgi:iron complex outermembrane receptor protein
VRYTDEERGLFGETTTYSSIPSVPVCSSDIDLSDIDPSYTFCSRGRADNSVKNDAWTWRAGAEYDVGDASMLYVMVDRGFKSGGIFSGRSPGNDYGPEFLTSYTAGMRNELFGQTLQLNLEGFYWDYTDYQFTFVNIDTLGVPALVTRNAGEARVYGGSIDVVWKPSYLDTLKLNVEYLNAKFTDFTYRECPGLGIVDVANTPGGGTTPLFGFDCSGLPLPRAPKWSINAGYQRVFELANGADIVFDADGQYSSSYKLDLTYVDFLTQDPFVWLNAQVAYHSPEDNWSIAAWVQNITNEAVYNDARRFGSTNYSGADIRPPRTFGVRGQVRF